jgi:hypothetical protein
MRKLLITYLLIFPFNDSISQNIENELIRILSVFPKCEVDKVLPDDHYEEVQASILNLIFNFGLSSNEVIYPWCYKKHEFGYSLIYQTIPPSGETTYVSLVVVDYNRYKIAQEFFGERYSYNRDETTNSLNFKFVNDTILEVQCDVMDFTFSELLDTKYTYYLIGRNGIATLSGSDLISKNRTYPKSSLKLLTKKEIGELTKSELDVMRNEIFADHGYIFKTDKWKDYFSKREWYSPRYENVNDSLSTIENYNIQLILELSKK